MTEEKRKNITDWLKEAFNSFISPRNAVHMILFLILFAKISWNSGKKIYTNGVSAVDTLWADNAHIRVIDGRMDTLEHWKREVTAYYKNK